MLETEGHKNKLLQRMLTVNEVAAILNVHPNTVRRWERKGLLKAHSIGPRYSIRFEQGDLLDFLDKSRNRVHAAT